MQLTPGRFDRHQYALILETSHRGKAPTRSAPFPFRNLH